MPFKINISTKDGKTYKLEVEAPALKQHKMGDAIKGEEISSDLVGYELEITGTSDKSGFTSMKDVEGMGLKKQLLGYGKAMHKRPKGDKKKPRPLTKGLRLRKTVRGNIISDAIIQINTKVTKEGSKKLSEIFGEAKPAEETEKKPEEETEAKVSEESESKPAETPKQEKSEQEVEKPKAAEAPNEAAPEQEPKEAETSKQEKAHPEEEPK